MLFVRDLTRLCSNCYVWPFAHRIADLAGLQLGHDSLVKLWHMAWTGGGAVVNEWDWEWIGVGIRRLCLIVVAVLSSVASKKRNGRHTPR